MSNSTCWCGGRVGPRTPGNSNGLGCLDSIYHDFESTGRPERIRTVYVAGPMSGLQLNNYPVFNEAAQRLRDAGYAVVDPAEFGSTGGHYVDLIRQDLRMMLEADAVAVLEGWWESVGARNEVQVAGVLKMPVRPLAEWLERAARELQ